MKMIDCFVISLVMVAAAAESCPKSVARTCGKPVRRGISSSDQSALLRAHNVLRNNVALGREDRGSQPSASNMKTMVWDSELAKLAQRWADQCTWAHNMCGGSSRFTVGQNLYAVISPNNHTSFNITQGVLRWYDEVKYFPKTSIKPFRFTEKTGHYTQLAWAKSSYLGCGYIVYRDSSTSLYRYTLVCDYGPAGNVIGGTMYETGTPCSACPSKRCHRAYDGLCA